MIDLQKKLDHLQAYYNEDRVHSSLNLKTPNMMAKESAANRSIVSLEEYRWNLRCGGSYQLPVAA